MKGSTSLSSGVVAGLSATTPPSISLSWSLGACPLGMERSRLKIEGEEGIRGLFGSGVVTSSSLDAYSSSRNVVQLVCLFVFLRLSLIRSESKRRQVWVSLFFALQKSSIT